MAKLIIKKSLILLHSDTKFKNYNGVGRIPYFNFQDEAPESSGEVPSVFINILGCKVFLLRIIKIEISQQKVFIEDLSLYKN